MTLRRRLTLAMAVVAAVTAAAVTVAVSEKLETSLGPLEVDRQIRLTKHLAVELQSTVSSVRADVSTALGSAPAEELLVRPESSVRPEEQAVLRAFSAMLRAHPDYIQARLLDAAGYERVRVERDGSGGPLRVVAPGRLQFKGKRAYFRESIGLPKGEVFVSPIELNQEHGRIQTPHVPVLRAATPVVTSGGRTLGIVIINVDMRGALARLRRGSPESAAIYLLNSAGNYLVHPDRQRDFAFELGPARRFSDDFPGQGDVVTARVPTAREIRVQSKKRFVMAAVPVVLARGPKVLVVSLAPSVRAAVSGRTLRTGATIAALTVLGAAFAAFLVARSVTRPLAQMTLSAEKFPEESPAGLPTARKDEIGVLSRALARAYDAIRQRTTDVERERSKFRQVIEAAPNAMLVIDCERTITLANAAADELFGYERAELIGQPIEVLVPARFRDVHSRHVGRFVAQHEARALGVGRELLAVRKDGQEVPVEIGLEPLDTPEGLFVLASIIDISVRKRAEEWFQRIVEAAPNAKIVVGRDGRIRLVNQAAERMFGYSRHEMLGESVEMLVPERSRPRHGDDVRVFFADPRARTMGVGRDLYGRHKDGREVPVEIGLSPVDGPDGVSTLASIIDITERKRSEDELRRSNAELEQFAYVASHDLQEPLRMVANYTELLADRYRGRLDERADKYIHYASDGARRMQRLVSDLLAYSRVGSQGKPQAPVASGAVVASVVESLGRVIESAGAAVEVAPLPEVMADEGQLRQLFQNLIGNAVKFRAQEPPRVTVSAERSGNRWVFSVVDNGIGFDMQYADRIFQMFQRLHELGKYEGSGIGLAIAKRIVERHGGRIWVESELGAGTTVRFSLAATQEQRHA